jgi:hypothetical protein
MQSWYGLWMEHKSKHQELLREAERERLFNRLRAALQAASRPNPATNAGRTAPFGPRDPARRDETASAGRRSSRATKVLREGSRPERGWSTESGQASDGRDRGKLAPDCLRPAER